jgi:hypothetical protein
VNVSVVVESVYSVVSVKSVVDGSVYSSVVSVVDDGSKVVVTVLLKLVV